MRISCMIDVFIMCAAMNISSHNPHTCSEFPAFVSLELPSSGAADAMNTPPLRKGLVRVDSIGHLHGWNFMPNEAEYCFKTPSKPGKMTGLWSWEQ
jgi:hypothetical protein